MNKEQFEQLCENIRISHSDLNYATENPFYVVQKRQTDYFKNKDSYDYIVWVDSENESEYRNYDPAMFDELSAEYRKKLNDISYEKYNELFDRIDEEHQRALLQDALEHEDECGNVSVRYCRDYWIDESWHLTHQSAENFIQKLAVDKFRIYAHSVNRCYELKALIKLLKENKLVLVENNEVPENKKGDAE